MEHKYYLVTFALPDGKHIMVMNAHPSKAIEHARTMVMSNPDAVFDEKDVIPMKSLEHMNEMVAALRAENPDRPLATDLGLDTPNRLLTEPQIARDLAAQQQSRGAGCC